MLLRDGPARTCPPGSSTPAWPATASIRQIRDPQAVTTLIIAAKVVGFDETTLRSAAVGEKKFVHGAFTGRYSLFHLGCPVAGDR